MVLPLVMVVMVAASVDGSGGSAPTGCAASIVCRVVVGWGLCVFAGYIDKWSNDPQ